MNKYTLEELIATFLDHHEKWEMRNKELIKEWKENNPGEEIPIYLKGDFSLPLAMASICKEVLNLKKLLD